MVRVSALYSHISWLHGHVHGLSAFLYNIILKDYFNWTIFLGNFMIM